MKSIEERLSDYINILEIYLNADKDSDIDYLYYFTDLTFNGMCNVFYRLLDVNVYYGKMKELYPELWKQKPRKSYVPDSDYWWKPSSIKPRIRALERAIELCKNK
jgi:hypothetical protein